MAAEQPVGEQPVGILRFDDRVAVVTGAGSGLGRSHALLLAERGATVVLLGRASSFETVIDVSREIEGIGGRCLPIQATIGDEDDAARAMATTIETFGRVDVVINNAGDARDQNVASQTPGEPLERMLRTHLVGPLQLNRAAWPHMVRQHYGRLLFTGSSNATGWMKGRIGYEVDYAAAKAALIAAMRQTAGEGADAGIKANMLMPWAYTRGVAGRLGSSPLGAWMRENLPERRVSAVAALLVHEDCPVTGEMISAQGGRVARVFFGATRGYYNTSLGPEDALAHWDTVMGTVDADGQLLDVFEHTMPREQRLIGEMTRAGRVPSLRWLADQSLREMDMGAAAEPAES
jgi:NAD(P)-dependent dehydrogenase (short-subunit alcohol dehydrogenase family)